MKEAKFTPPPKHMDAKTYSAEERAHIRSAMLESRQFECLYVVLNILYTCDQLDLALEEKQRRIEELEAALRRLASFHGVDMTKKEAENDN